MATTHIEVMDAESAPRSSRIVNDLSIQVATVNGSVSQTANTALLRALFERGIPVSAICPDAKRRKLVRNMIYDGVVAKLLGIEVEEIRIGLEKQFKKKAKAAELNWNAARAGYDYAEKSLTKADRFWVERMDKNQGKFLIDGNSACALGAMFGGVTICTWYPITPS